MRRVRTLLAAIMVPAFACSALADSKTFKNSGLKNEIVVMLDVQGKGVTGAFSSAEYGADAPPSRKFTGHVVETPKGKKGVYLRIKFDGDVPYSPPSGIKDLIWHLTIVNHRAHLFIPMQERSYEGKTPKWIVSEVELEPAD